MLDTSINLGRSGQVTALAKGKLECWWKNRFSTSQLRALAAKRTNHVLGCMKNTMKINWHCWIMIWQRQNSNWERVSSDTARLSNIGHLIETSVCMTHFNVMARDIPFLETATYKRLTCYHSAFGDLVTWRIIQLHLNMCSCTKSFWNFNGIQLIATTALVRGHWNCPVVFTNGAAASLNAHKATVKIVFQ